MCETWTLWVRRQDSRAEACFEHESPTHRPEGDIPLGVTIVFCTTYILPSFRLQKSILIRLYSIIVCANRKFLFATGILLLSILSIFFLWRHPIILSIILLLIAYIKSRIYSIKAEWQWFAIICFGGALVEIWLVNFSHVWSYNSSQLINIPIWIPIFWGTVGTTIIVMYEGLTD